MDKLQETAKSLLLGTQNINEASDEEIANAMLICSGIQDVMKNVIEQLQNKTYVRTVGSADKFMPGVTRNHMTLIKGAKDILKTAIRQEGKLLDQLNVQMRHRKNESEEEQQIDENLEINAYEDSKKMYMMGQELVSQIGWMENPKLKREIDHIQKRLISLMKDLKKMADSVSEEQQQIDETLSNDKIYQNLVRRSAIIQQDLDDIHDEDSRQFKETEKELAKIWKEMNKIEKQHGIKR